MVSPDGEKGNAYLSPLHSGDKVDFKRVTSYDEVATDYVQTTQSAKRFAFPKTEVLFSYQKDGKEATLQEADIHAIPETILWKIRPCDAAGFAPLSGIFNWDYKDKLYNARREKMTLISFSCAQCDESCFCTSVHGGPVILPAVIFRLRSCRIRVHWWKS